MSGPARRLRLIVTDREWECNCAEWCLICGRHTSEHGKAGQECPIPPCDGYIERFVASGCDC